MSELCARPSLQASVADSALSRVTPTSSPTPHQYVGRRTSMWGVKPFGELEAGLGCQRDPICYHQVKITCGCHRRRIRSRQVHRLESASPGLACGYRGS